MDNTQTQTNVRVISTKRKVITSVVVGVLAIGLGAGAGFAGYKLFGQKNTASYEYDANALTDDIAIAQDKLAAAKKSGTPLETALRPYEMVNLAFANLSALPSNKSVGIGVADAGVSKQDIQSIQIKNGDSYFEESNSVGIVNLFDRMYQNGDTITCYWGTKKDYSADTPTDYSLDDYIELMGRKVSDPCSYIVSSKTCWFKEENNKSGKGVSSITKDGDIYRVECELNNQKGVTNYVRQMKNISGLTGYPVFDYCHLSFQISEDLMPIQYTSYEHYTATKASIPVPTPITGEMTVWFSTDGEYPIPSLTDSTSEEYAAHAN